MGWFSFFGGRKQRLEHLLEALFAMRVGQDVGQILSETLDQLRGVLEARSVMLFFFEAQEEQLYRWIAGAGGASQSVTEMQPSENQKWMDFSGPIHLEHYGPENPLCERLKARSLVSVGAMEHGNYERLLVVDSTADLNSGTLGTPAASQ